MKDYCYINENGDKIDYYELVNDNGMLCEEIEQLQQENERLKSIIKTLIKEYDLEPTEYVKNLLECDNNAK